jgi:predicted RNA binding protein YcfA (HicA-like mRNA interferase family)
MSTKTPVVTGDRLIRVLRRIGFRVSTVVGSHHVLRRPDGRSTSVPVHAGRTLKRGTLAAILADADMTADDLRRLL